LLYIFFSWKFWFGFGLEREKKERGGVLRGKRDTSEWKMSGREEGGVEVLERKKISTDNNFYLAYKASHDVAPMMQG